MHIVIGCNHDSHRGLVLEDDAHVKDGETIDVKRYGPCFEVLFSLSPASVAQITNRSIDFWYLMLRIC